jgi:hypothetical protein
LRDLVEDLAADNTVNENIRGQLGVLHTAMNTYTATVNQMDLSPVIHALNAVAAKKGKANIHNLSHLQ